MAADYQLVDMRRAEEFAAGHVPGSVNIPSTSKSFATYAGTVLRYDKPILLIAPPGRERDQILDGFRMIGLNPSATANARELTDAFRSGKRGAMLKTTTAELFAKQRNGAHVIDVRNTNEWKDGHIPEATHIYLGELASRAESLPKDAPIVVHCQSGVRSFVGASLLQSLGFTDVTSMKDGIDSWRRAGLPLTKD
jgi:hydroxyacylglutathione hydrolase